MPSRHRVPLWLMGLTNLSYGLYGGVIAFALPQLLGGRNVPETAIAGLTAVAFSPSFYAFLVSPILDVRFSRLVCGRAGDRGLAHTCCSFSEPRSSRASGNRAHRRVFRRLSLSKCHWWMALVHHVRRRGEVRQRLDDDRQCWRLRRHGH